ncbi:MAG: cyclic nucleotide-binding domain-containing protein [Acidimicrobiia bacterium]|nr:cyclic nucleotide-binding domain-containing protein [Acidimicrobiia bacterium]MDH3397539.1 cyclic nucleotide-binding domain-containing protein [Acidimicrobiia bacterium]
MAVLKRRSDRVEALRVIPLFSHLSKKDLNELAKRSDEVAVARGTVLAKEGERGNQCFVILSGKVAVSRNGRKITARRWGAVIGEMALLDGMPRSATLVAEEDSVLLVIHRREFQYLIDNLPGFSRKLLMNLSGHLRRMDKALDV